MILTDALAAHEHALFLGGGRHGISNISDIEGALGRPYHGYHRPIARKAGALLHGMATSHGFIDANKRTAWLITQALIEGSDYILAVKPDDRIDDIVVAVVEGTMTEEELVIWYRERITRPMQGE